MSHIIPSGTIARTLLLAGILLAVTVLAAQSFFPAFAQTVPDALPTMGTEEIDYDENGTDPVVVYTATDPEGETSTWSIVDPTVETTANSPDAEDFEIPNGVLRFKNSPNYESPTDRTGASGNDAADNTYVVQVRASTSDGPHHTVTVTVNVQNVNEPGKVSFGHPQPKERTAISVTLTDDDGPNDGDAAGDGDGTTATLTDNASTTWQWYRSETGSDPWTKIEEMATSSAYTPVDADVGHYLRATAMYFDAQDDEQRTAHSKVSDTNKVQVEEYINTPPMFRDDDEDAVGTQINMSVPEDESLEEGDAVGQPIMATDIGEDGSPEVLTYSITVGTGFTIDSDTGQLKLGAGTTLDAEGTAAYTVTVRATDPSGRFSDATVTINITNVDEAPTITGDDEPEQDENTAITTAVATYTGADDEGDTANLTWSLTGTNRTVFEIGGPGATAALTFKSLPNYEALSTSIKNNGYKVTVNATDSNGNTGSLPVTVKVTNVEETETVTLSHPEARVGVSITARLSNEDRPTGITWSWSQGGTPIPGATGSSYRPTTDSGTLVATASYTDNISSGKTAVSSAHTVVAAVSGSGNTTPTVTDPGTQTVSETATIDTAVVTIGATDSDGDSTFLFKLTSGGNWFNLNEVTGVLTTKIPLNHEQRDSYTVTVTATDSSLRTSPGRRVTIEVDNVDEDPVIAEGGATIEEYPEIKNGRPNTDPVFTYSATDDEDNNANLGWSLSADTVFELSNTTGANTTLRFISTPDFEDDTFTNPATVTITVTDSDSQTATRAVSVNVINVDEPGTVTGLPAQPKQGVLMTVMLVDDPDGGVTGQDDTLTDNASTTWEWYRSRSSNSGWTLITATSTDNMNVNTNTRTPEAADIGNYLRATAKYSDGQGDDKVAHGITTRPVQAKEYVNTPPVFRDDDDEAAGYQITMELPEDNSLRRGDAVGDPIDDLVTDTDQNGLPEILTYTVALVTGDGDAGSDQNDFDIDSLTGQLRFSDAAGGTAASKLLDFENTTDITSRQYQVRVKATDPAATSSTALVTIEIVNVDEDPELAMATETANLAATSTLENPATTTLSSYTASDDEETDANGFEWSLSGADEDMFLLCTAEATTTDCGDVNASGSVSNPVYLRFKPSDYEAPADSGGNNVYNVAVTVTDSDDQTDTRDVIVEVTNRNEPGTVTLSHIQPEVGTSIRASLTDPDGGVSGTSWEWFWCTPGVLSGGECPDGDRTKINTTSSAYTPISDGRHIQAKATYTDRASKAGEDKRTAEMTSVNPVQVDDTTNQPPVLPDVTQTLTIAENSEATDPVFVVGTVAATSDPDDELVSILYTLSGSDAAFFTIHSGVTPGTPPTGSATSSTAGMIRLKSGTELDYETKNTYRVTVTATDPSLARDTVAVVINVTNVNEPPTVSQRGLTVTGPSSVSYDEDRTDAVVTYRVVGPDASGATWSLSGADASAFTIPGGALTFNTQPDFESAADANTDNMYNVTVMATMGTFSDDHEVTVSVANVDEPGTVALTYDQNQVRVGVAITAEEPVDPDGGVTGVTWQWESSSDGTTNWSDIAGASARLAAYTPVDGDAGNFLRATASYTDIQGAGKTATSEATPSAVLASTGAGTPGTVSLSPTGGLTSGDSVTASLDDADNPTNEVWVWERSANGSTGWTAISGATSATYTTTDDDAGDFLRASVTYDDDSGPGQTAGPAATTDLVAIDSEYDSNTRGGTRDGIIDGPEVLNAVVDYFSGVIGPRRVLDVVALYFRNFN